MARLLDFTIDNAIAVSIVAVVYFFFGCFTSGYLAGKGWFQNNYYNDDKTEFWLAVFWPVFWVAWFFWNTRKFFWYFIRYSPFWLAYDLGMFLAGANRKKTE